jgi:alanine dehydrogenase
MDRSDWGPTRLISRDQIVAAIDLDDARTVVEEVLRGLAAERVAMPAKVTMNLAPFGLRAWNTAMPAYIESLKASGFKWVGGFADNPVQHGLPFLIALVLVQDPNTGYPLALMDGVHITNLRTAALNALIASLYARPDSHRLALVGAGVQARFAVAALRTVLPLDEIRVHDIEPAAAEGFLREVAPHGIAEVAPHGIAVTVCDTAEAAVRDADVVITATPSTTPLVRRAWLGRGVTAISIGSQGQEFDDETILGADKLVCDSWEQCAHLGELRELAENGRLTRADVHAEIADTLAGRRAGRETDDELILVVPIGLGAFDIALARVAFDRIGGATETPAFRFFEHRTEGRT